MRFVFSGNQASDTGMTLTVFHLLMWYALQQQGLKDKGEPKELRVNAYALAEAKKSSLLVLTGTDFARIKALPIQPEGRPAWLGDVEEGKADVIIFDCTQRDPSVIRWIDSLEIPTACAQAGARVTMLLIFDNRASLYRDSLRAITQYASHLNVDFLLLHIPRSEAETLEVEKNKRAFDRFKQEVAALIPEHQQRLGFATLPYLDQTAGKTIDLIVENKATLLDLRNGGVTDSFLELARLTRLWLGYFTPFTSHTNLLLP